MSRTAVELIIRTLSTMVAMAMELLETIKLLPSKSVLLMENSVSEPSLRALSGRQGGAISSTGEGKWSRG